MSVTLDSSSSSSRRSFSSPSSLQLHSFLFLHEKLDKIKRATSANEHDLVISHTRMEQKNKLKNVYMAREMCALMRKYEQNITEKMWKKLRGNFTFLMNNKKVLKIF